MSEPLRASRTAVLVCQGRAAADGRIAAGRFADPTAMVLLRPDEREAVERVRDGVVPRQWRQRLDYETVLSSGELMAPRTVAIDDAVREPATGPCLETADTLGTPVRRRASLGNGRVVTAGN